MTILPLTYLGSIEYFYHLINDECIIEQYANYVRQTPTNRCAIAGPNSAQILSIPVIKQTGKTPVKDILIDNKCNWQTQHWRAIESAYNSAPFFEYFKDDLHKFYENHYKYLRDFNLEIQNCVLNLLEYNNTKHILSDKYINTEENKYFNTNDLRETLLSKKNNVPLRNSLRVPYYQVFSHKIGFTEGLSIIDLLFNMGMESRIILSQE